MSESVRLAEYAWDDAESLVDRLDFLCNQGVAAEQFNQELVDGIAGATGAIAVSLWHADASSRLLLARQGIDIDDPLEVPDRETNVSSVFAALTHWPKPETLVCRQITHVDNADRNGSSDSGPSRSKLMLQMRFEPSVTPSRRGPTEELCCAVMGIACLFWLRQRYVETRHYIHEQQARDQTLGLLYSGCSLEESLSIIASTLARETGVDRVSILDARHSHCRLIASSSSTQIDKRSRHVRLMQELVVGAIHDGSSLTHIVGRKLQTNAVISPSLDSYIDESGACEIRIETVTKSKVDDTAVAAILFENFRIPGSDRETRFESFKSPASDAIRAALSRDEVAWQSVMSRWFRGNVKRNAVLAVCLSGFLLGFLTLIPIRFAIPVEGFMAPRQHVRLFAPADATVESILVTSGQPVKRGDTLLVLRSVSLDVQEKTLAGELETFQSQLAALQVSKSGLGRDAAPRESASRSDQRVLETMIASVQERLELVRQQQRELTIQSPMDGLAQQLDLQESLLSRPIRRGQHLINLVAPDAGWIAKLDIPDSEIGYVIESNQQSTATCRFRLRSHPTRVFTGEISRIENSSHINTDGKSVVRVVVTPDDSVSDLAMGDFRDGATVMSSIDCGHRPAGFVWFRSLVEWFRCQSWI